MAGRRTPQVISTSTDVATREIPGGVTAAVADVALDGTGWRTWRLGDQRWQEEAWRHLDISGELRYATNWISNAISRCRLYVAKIDKSGKPGNEVTEPELQLLSETMFGGPAMKAEAMRRIAGQLFVAGESYIVAEDVASASKDIWYVCSNSEVRRSGSTGVVVDRSNIFGGGKFTLREGKDLCLRVWTPHPRRYDAADSSVRSVLPILREIEQLTKKKMAEGDSRLAGAGVLFVPMETEFPTGDSVTKGKGGSIATLLTRAAAAAIQDQSAASALVPIIAKVPGDQIANIKWQTFQTPFQAETQQNLEGAIRRLAIGLDLPPEVLMGQGDTNHWSAWQIEESVIKIQIEPLLIRICDALTQGWLKPALKILKKDEEEFCVWYSTSALVVRPNREQTAKDLNEMGVVSDEVLREEANFTEEAKPGKKEYEQKLALKAIALNPQLISNEDVQKALGIQWKIEDPNAAPADQGMPQDQGGFPQDQGMPIDQTADQWQPGAQDRPWDIPTMPSDQGSPAQQQASLEGALLVGADLIVRRALERGGSRLLTRALRSSGEFAAVPSAELHTRVAVPREKAEQLLADAFGPATDLAERVGMEPETVTAMLSTYTTSLMALGAPHEFDRFATYVTSALDLIGHDECAEFCRNPLHPGPCAGPERIHLPGEGRRRAPRPGDRGGFGGARKRQPKRPESQGLDAATEDLTAAIGGDNAARARVEQHARQTYEFTDPDTGMRSVVVGVHPASSQPSRGAGVVVDMKIYDASGAEVGNAKRTWRIDPSDGKLHVRHAHMDLDQSVQGGGFSRRWNAQAYESYRQMGVPDVTLQADVTVGGAAWALEGYDFTNPQDMMDMARRFSDAASRMQDGPVKDEIRALVARSTMADFGNGTHPSPYEWVMVGRAHPSSKRTRGTKNPITTWPGKSIMLGSDWEGVLSITSPYRPSSRGPRDVPPGATVPEAQAAAMPPKMTAPPAPDSPAVVDQLPQDAGWDERAGFLADANDMALAYANSVANDVPNIPNLVPDSDHGNDYPEHHHYFGADQDQTDQYMGLADQLLTAWGRDEGPADKGGIVAHAGCAEFCRNPLHPGPCRGWRVRLRAKKARGDITTPRAHRGGTPGEALREARRGGVQDPHAPSTPTPGTSRRGVRMPGQTAAERREAERQANLERLRQEAAAHREAEDRILQTAQDRADYDRQRDIVSQAQQARVLPRSMTPTHFAEILRRSRRGEDTPQDYQEISAVAHAIWDHNDPGSGLHSLVETVDMRDGQVRVTVSIYDDQNRRVGSSTRSFGQTSAYHAYLQLSRDVQGGGFAERYNARAYQAYAEMGLRRVSVNADIDVGGYTWATQGFDWESYSDLANMVQRGIYMYSSWGPEAQADFDALLRRGTSRADYEAGRAPTPYELAMIGRSVPRLVPRYGPNGEWREPLVMWDGKAYMLGSNWHGVRPITTAVRPGGPVPFKRGGKVAKKAAPAAVTAAMSTAPAAPPPAEEMELVDTMDPAARKERDEFLLALADDSLAYANTFGDVVPVVPEDAHPNRAGETDYNANQHLISADLPQVMVQLDVADELLAQWGRTETEPVEGGVTAAAHNEFCRNPLHPGPCKGWRRQLHIPSRKRITKGETKDEGHRRRAAMRERRAARGRIPEGQPGPHQPPLTDEEFTERQALVERTIGDAVPTLATEHTHTDEHGSWTAERDAIHRAIAAELYARADHVPRDGRAVIAGGLGGAGKSTVLRDYAGIDASQYLTINPDDIKELMASRGLVPEVPGVELSPMERAALVHEESSRIAALLADMAYRDRTNVIWDITMSSRSSVASRLSALRRHGYDDVRGIFVDIPVETSVERAMARYRRGVDEYRAGRGYGGRFVPPHIIRAARTEDGRTINRHTFEGLQGEFDDWAVYDNAGTAPRLVEQGGGQ